MKDPALLRLKGVGAGKVLTGPEVVDIHLTDQCNLACEYCLCHSPGQPKKARQPMPMSFLKFRQVVRDCVELKVRSVGLSASGEPTLHPRFVDMMALLHKEHFEVTLLTNGTFSSKVRTAVLKADAVTVNLAASDRTKYLRVQGADLFDRVLGNLRRMVDFRNTVKPGFRIGVMFVANAFNKDDEAAVRQLVEKIGVDHFKRVTAETNRHNRHLALDRPAGKDQPSPGWFPCFNGWYYAMVKADGRMGLCCYARDHDVLDLKRLSFKQAWRSAEFARIRLDMKFGRFQKTHHECRHCPNAARNRAVAQMLARVGK